LSASYPLPQRINSGGGQLTPLRVPPERQGFIKYPIARWLTDDLLFHYQRCSRRAFLDLYGTSTQPDPPSDYLEKLKQDSTHHRQGMLQRYQPRHRPIYPARDWQAGRQATQALMAQGVDHIAQGVLTGPATAGIALVSRPDLLIKQPGKSFWGDWYYVPMDIKLGKKPKLDYQVIAAFHAYLLSHTQGMWPEESWLALREGRLYSVDLVRQVPKMQEVLASCLQDLEATTAPSVFISHSRCDLCHWFSHCYNQAKATQHLSLLPGVTPARYNQLQRLQLTTVEALALANPRRLAPLPGFGVTVAEKLVHQAQATLYNQAIARTDDDDCFPLTPEHLPSAAVELYFDIEAAPDQDLIYLHGVLVVDHATGREQFHALLAETPEHEYDAWQSFLALVHRYPEAPIYHFCPYETQTARRLAHLYGTPDSVVESVLQRFVDIHWCITESVTLPIESYALKHIARWIGFDWRDAGANGAQSICWYNDWLATCDRTYLEAILRYNEDDCRATYWIKRWLVEFAQPLWQSEP